MPIPEEEILKVRDRLHRMNDVVQVHELTLHEHGIKIDQLEKQVSSLFTQAATREQLDAAVLSLGEKVAAAVTLMSLQIKTIAENMGNQVKQITDTLDPIRKGIYWVITLVFGAVILAGLSFLLRRP